MLTKLLVTALVVVLAWIAVRDRWRSDATRAARNAAARERPPLVPRGAVRMAAYGVVALMLIGSGLYLFQDWKRRSELVQIEVANPYTGTSAYYTARRGDIDRRSFVTLDGRRVRVAETERIILGEPERE